MRREGVGRAGDDPVGALVRVLGEVVECQSRLSCLREADELRAGTDAANFVALKEPLPACRDRGSHSLVVDWQGPGVLAVGHGSAALGARFVGVDVGADVGDGIWSRAR